MTFGQVSRLWNSPLRDGRDPRWPGKRFLYAWKPYSAAADGWIVKVENMATGSAELWLTAPAEVAEAPAPEPAPAPASDTVVSHRD